MLHKELQQRIAKEYHHAASKMQQSSQPAKKLFYFSALFGEAQRILNWEWDRDIALIYMVTQQTYNQIHPTTQAPLLGVLFPVEGAAIYEKLTQATIDLAAYFEKMTENDNHEELYQILGRMAEVSYIVSGNGSYLYEKGLIKL